MRIGIYYTGEFGQKVIGNLVNSSTFCISCGDLCDQCRTTRPSFAGNITDIHELPGDLPEFVDDPETYLPNNMAACDLLIAIDLHPDIFAVLPSIVRATGAQAVIAPVETPKLAPEGLIRQVRNELEAVGVDCEFPKPFCSLKRNGKELIDQFVDMGFGRPLLKLELDIARNVITHAQVLRDAPCGGTWFVARCLGWSDIEDYKDTVSQAHHSYPCTASMDRDPQLKDTILHEAGHIIRTSVEEAIHNASK
ncbi:MAG: DUF166 domain-containing protein [Euryarchaeota archaeon]|nr:DUF166 domain-containing protein [Euryarchaeota archaeon]